MREWEANFELRVKQDSTVLEMKKMIQKVVINFWNIGLSSSNIYKKNITVMKELNIIKKEGLRDSLHQNGFNIGEISGKQAFPLDL